MPEFVLDIGDSYREFSRLDEFTQGYIEALFFTDTEPGSVRKGRGRKWNPEMDSSLPGDVGFSDLAPSALARIVADCKAFQEKNADDLTEACDNGRINGYDMQAAGRDYWYTRNGHGVGFWDRQLGDVGDTLTKACDMITRPGINHAVDVYLGDDGLIYIMGAE